MPGYIEESLHKFQHPTHKRHQHAPHDWIYPAYGLRFQYTRTELELPTLDPVGTQWVQSIADNFLYYPRSVNPTMLPYLNKIYTQKQKPTVHTIKKCNCLLYYAENYPNTVIWYYASDMILHGDTNDNLFRCLYAWLYWRIPSQVSTSDT